jgi:indole-3-glycerol phosphate synthase
MTPLVEVHSQRELERVLKIDGVQLIGINNRDLKDFSVDLSTTQQLIAASQGTIQQKQICMVSESGLHTAEDLAFVQQAGVQAVLIGESLMRYGDPAEGIAQLFHPNS